MGSTPLENGKELKEGNCATGFGYLSLGKLYPLPRYTSEIIHLYFLQSENFGEMEPDDDEFLEVERILWEKAVEMVLNNDIPDSKTPDGGFENRHAAGKRNFVSEFDCGTGRNQDAGEPTFINLRLVFAWRCDLLLYCTEAYQTLSPEFV